MNWLTLTTLTENSLEVSGSSVAEVADEVVSTVTSNITDVQKQTNIFIQYLLEHIPNVISFGINVLIAILIFFVGKKLINLVRKIVKRSLTKMEADVGVMQFLDALVKAILYFILAVIIVSRFGIAASSVMAIVGSAGLAVGLALQGSLANFAGGVLILLLKPFKVGDYIIAGEEGTVTQIHIFYTVLLTSDNKTIYIPNGTLSNGNIINVTAQENRLVVIQTGIGYNSDLKLAKEVLNKLGTDYEKRIADKPVAVAVTELAASEVTLVLKVWVKTEDYWETKFSLTEQIKYAFDENGIEIPYNQLDVHLTK